jgi:hypothetical protein
VVALVLAVLGQVPLIVIPLVLGGGRSRDDGPRRQRPQAARADADDVGAGDDRRRVRVDPRHPGAHAGGPGRADHRDRERAVAGASKVDEALASGQSLASIVVAFAQPIAQAVGAVVFGLAGLGISSCSERS